MTQCCSIDKSEHAGSFAHFLYVGQSLAYIVARCSYSSLHL